MFQGVFFAFHRAFLKFSSLSVAMFVCGLLFMSLGMCIDELSFVLFHLDVGIFQFVFLHFIICK